MLDRVELDAELLDLLRRARGWLPAPARCRAPDAWRCAISSPDVFCCALQPFELGDQPPPRGFERRDFLERLVGIEPAVAQAGADLFDVIADVVQGSSMLPRAVPL